jgi:hypothetical protein
MHLDDLDENDDDSSDADPYQNSDEDDDASCLYCNCILYLNLEMLG